MFFNQSQIPNAIDIPFNWVADYFDGTYQTEYNFNNHIKHDFYSINQNDVIRFGLFGQRMKFYFENIDGSFSLNGRRLDIAYEVDGKSYLLTNNTNKKDFITYKQAYTIFNQKNGPQNSNIESINFGYKTRYNKDDISLFFQPVISLSFNASAYIEVKLTSSKNLNGELVFIHRGKEVERFHAPLEANISMQINWTIKQ